MAPFPGYDPHDDGTEADGGFRSAAETDQPKVIVSSGRCVLESSEDLALRAEFNWCFRVGEDASWSAPLLSEGLPSTSVTEGPGKLEEEGEMKVSRAESGGLMASSNSDQQQQEDTLEEKRRDHYFRTAVRASMNVKLTFRLWGETWGVAPSSLRGG